MAGIESINCNRCGAPVEQVPGVGACYCARCSFEQSVLCSGCHLDAGNGAGGYSACCGYSEAGPVGSGAPVELRGVLVLNTFQRHPVKPREVADPVLEKLGWKSVDYVVFEHYVDGREELDFSDPEYLGDALRRVEEGLGTVDFAGYDLVVCNFTGFNPTSFRLVSLLADEQRELLESPWRKHPQIWAVHYDRERGYLAYELGLWNKALAEMQR